MLSTAQSRPAFSELCPPTNNSKCCIEGYMLGATSSAALGNSRPTSRRSNTDAHTTAITARRRTPRAYRTLRNRTSHRLHYTVVEQPLYVGLAGS